MDLFFNLNIKEVDLFDSLVVNDTNYSACFHQFQQGSYRRTKEEKLTFESDSHILLAFSSVLLLTDNFPDSMISFFPVNSLAYLKTYLIKDIGTGDFEFPRNHLITIIDLMKSVIKSETEREVASVNILALSMKETGVNKKILLMFNKFVMQLPLKSQIEPVDEADLCSRFLLPALQSLFDEQFADKQVLVKLSNVKNLECQLSKFDVSKRRPDGQIQLKLLSTNKTVTVGFNETKKNI